MWAVGFMLLGLAGCTRSHSGDGTTPGSVFCAGAAFNYEQALRTATGSDGASTSDQRNSRDLLRFVFDNDFADSAPEDLGDAARLVVRGAHDVQDGLVSSRSLYRYIESFKLLAERGRKQC